MPPQDAVHSGIERWAWVYMCVMGSEAVQQEPWRRPCKRSKPRTAAPVGSWRRRIQPKLGTWAPT